MQARKKFGRQPMPVRAPPATCKNYEERRAPAGVDQTTRALDAFKKLLCVRRVVGLMDSLQRPKRPLRWSARTCACLAGQAGASCRVFERTRLLGEVATCCNCSARYLDGLQRPQSGLRKLEQIQTKILLSATCFGAPAFPGTPLRRTCSN